MVARKRAARAGRMDREGRTRVQRLGDIRDRHEETLEATRARSTLTALLSFPFFSDFRPVPSTTAAASLRESSVAHRQPLSPASLCSHGRH